MSSYSVSVLSHGLFFLIAIYTDGISTAPIFQQALTKDVSDDLSMAPLITVDTSSKYKKKSIEPDTKRINLIIKEEIEAFTKIEKTITNGTNEPIGNKRDYSMSESKILELALDSAMGANYDALVDAKGEVTFDAATEPILFEENANSSGDVYQNISCRDLDFQKLGVDWVYAGEKLKVGEEKQKQHKPEITMQFLFKNDVPPEKQIKNIYSDYANNNLDLPLE